MLVPTAAAPLALADPPADPVVVPAADAAPPPPGGPAGPIPSAPPGESEDPGRLDFDGIRKQRIHGAGGAADGIPGLTRIFGGRHIHRLDNRRWKYGNKSIRPTPQWSTSTR